jgi:DNA-binding YbaB/EbfC family protein
LLNKTLTQNTKIMVGVGKLLKQAQKMQQKMEEAQALLSEEIIEVSGGGGAVSIKISGQGEFKELKLDPEFLKEDAEFVSEAILQSIVDASEQAKKKNDEAMSGLTGGMQMPGLF